MIDRLRKVLGIYDENKNKNENENENYEVRTYKTKKGVFFWIRIYFFILNLT